MIEVKILGYHSSQRYAIRQILVAVQRQLQDEIPTLKLAISELKNWIQIEQYTHVLSAPSLVINGELVCVGRIPSKQEVAGWIRDSMKE